MIAVVTFDYVSSAASRRALGARCGNRNCQPLMQNQRSRQMLFGAGSYFTPAGCLPGSASPGVESSEIDADSRHQLTRRDELIACRAYAKYVGEARIDAVLIR